MSDSPYLTIQDAAERGKFCRNTIKAAIASGCLPHMRIGRLVRIHVDEFDKWMSTKIVGTIESRAGSCVAGWTGGYDEKTGVNHK